MAVDFKEYARRMDKALEHLNEEFGAVRAGRANAKVLDRISVEYYGSETPLNGVATISSPDARTLVIQPWDTKLLKDIQKAIQTSDLGINPQNDGRVIRLTFPQLTYDKVLADNLKATDITAMALAMDNNMTMVCFGLDEENSIVRVVRGEAIGTTVKNNF